MKEPFISKLHLKKRIKKFNTKNIYNDGKKKIKILKRKKNMKKGKKKK